MTIYRHLDVDPSTKIFVFGDIHGNFASVEKAYRDLGIRDKDIKIFLGDLTDRGHQNFKSVITAHRSLNAYSILGNHEDMMVNGLLNGDRENYQCWMMNGGDTVVDELTFEGAQCIAEIVKDAPVVLTVTRGNHKFAFSHAEWCENLKDISPFEIEKLYNKATPQTKVRIQQGLVWGRDVITRYKKGVAFDKVKGVDYIFHGHSVLKQPLFIANRLYMDTGSVFPVSNFSGGCLTVAVLEPDNHQIKDELIDGYMWLYSTLETE